VVELLDAQVAFEGERRPGGETGEVRLGLGHEQTLLNRGRPCPLRPQAGTPSDVWFHVKRDRPVDNDCGQLQGLFYCSCLRSSTPMMPTMRSRSSTVANSIVIRPFRRPMSTFTRVSNRSESRSARSDR